MNELNNERMNTTEHRLSIYEYKQLIKVLSVVVDFDV